MAAASPWSTPSVGRPNSPTSRRGPAVSTAIRTGSTPGPRSVSVSPGPVVTSGRISARRGSRRWLRNDQSASTTMKLRSWTRPVGVSSAHASGTAAHPFTG